MDYILRDKGVALAEEGNLQGAELFLKRAIDNGDLLAINDLGVVYERKEDYESALDCYLRASKYGLGIAMCNIGNMFENGLGVDQSYIKAIKYYQKAIKHKCSFACHSLATLYRLGRGVEKNEKLALSLNIKGAKLERKTPEQCINAVELSYFYDKGIGTKYNKRKAFKYALLAAKKNDPVGLYNVAECYLYGKGTFKNIKKAKTLLLKAIKLGYGDAFYKLSEFYEKGLGVKQDFEAAGLWLVEAIKHNSFRAYLKYADMCLAGQIDSICPRTILASEVIADFLLEIDSSYIDELEEYQELKKKYIDALPWDDIETHAYEYSMKNRQVERC